MNDLHMVQLEISPRAIMQLGKDRGLPLRTIEQGYLAHSFLRELFGERAPQPFFEEAKGRWVRILGYSSWSAAELRAHADSFAEPLLHQGVNWDRFASKLLPSSWEPGRRLGFETRVCPVVRKSSSGEKHRKGAEVDAFLARCWSVGEGVPVDREEVYSEWLRGQLERTGAARLETVRMIAFQRERVLRRTQGDQRKAAIIERPDARLQGVLQILDGAAFGDLLRRGLGRHRAFGFGMLLLRRAEPPC